MSLLTNLISYWKLDEASGNALDAQGSNTLTANGGPGTVTGIIKTARHFTNSSHQYFSIADNTDLSTGDIDFTIQAWVYLDSKTNYAAYVSKWENNSSSTEYTLWYDIAADRFKFSIRDTTDTTQTDVLANTFGSPSIGNWYLLHAWHDSVNNLIGISVNAGVANTTSTSGGCRDSTSPFTIGRWNGGTLGDVDGAIDEVGFWKKVLTGQERQDLYNDGNGLEYAGFAYGAAAWNIAKQVWTEATRTLGTLGGINTSLKAFWRMNDPLDSYNEEILTSGGATHTTGKVGNAGSFVAASSQYYNRASDSNLIGGDIDFTISCWVKITSFPGTSMSIIAKGNLDSSNLCDYVIVYSNGASRFQFYVSDGATFTSISADTLGAPSTGTWYFITAWHDSVGNTLNIQVNGGGVDTVSYSAGATGTSQDLCIGRNTGGTSRYFDGLVDEAGFWKRVLTSGQRTSLYNSGSGIALFPDTVDLSIISKAVWENSVRTLTSSSILYKNLFIYQALNRSNTY